MNSKLLYHLFTIAQFKTPECHTVKTQLKYTTQIAMKSGCTISGGLL